MAVAFASEHEGLAIGRARGEAQVNRLTVAGAQLNIIAENGLGQRNFDFGVDVGKGRTHQVFNDGFESPNATPKKRTAAKIELDTAKPASTGKWIGALLANSSAAELVVPRPFTGVGKNAVGFVNLFELLFHLGSFAPGLVGVVLMGKLPIRSFNLVWRRLPFYSQNVVIIVHATAGRTPDNPKTPREGNAIELLADNSLS